MSQHITQAMIDAHAVLINFARTLPRYANCTAGERAVAEAIDILDNADFFVPITDARDSLDHHQIGLPSLAPGEEVRPAFSDTHPRAAREFGSLFTREDERQRSCGCGGRGTHGVDHDD